MRCVYPLATETLRRTVSCLIPLPQRTTSLPSSDDNFQPAPRNAPTSKMPVCISIRININHQYIYYVTKYKTKITHSQGGIAAKTYFTWENKSHSFWMHKIKKIALEQHKKPRISILSIREVFTCKFWMLKTIKILLNVIKWNSVEVWSNEIWFFT